MGQVLGFIKPSHRRKDRQGLLKLRLCHESHGLRDLSCCSLQPPHRLHGGYLQQDHGPRLPGKGGEWMMEVSLLGTFTFRVSRHFGFRSFSCCTVWITANSYVIEQQAQIGPAFATS